MIHHRSFYRSLIIPVSLFMMALLVSFTSGQHACADTQRTTAKTLTWSNPLEVASGNAHRGPWRMNRSEYDFVDDGTVATNDQGYVAVAWADHVKQDIFIQVYSPDDQPLLDQPVNVSRSEDIFSWLPRVWISHADEPDNIRIYMIWQDIVFRGGGHGGEIFFSRSTDGGRTFSTPYNLSDTIAGSGKGRTDPQRWHNGSYDLAICAQGNIYAAWTEYEGNLWFSRSTDGGETFAPIMHLAGGEDALPARGPTLAVNADHVYLAWTVGDTTSSDIHYAVSTDAGRSFGEPRVVHQSDGHADSPRLVVDSNNTLHLVYAESPNGPYERYHLRYTRLPQGQDTFAEPNVIVAPEAVGLASIHFPVLKLDGNDHLYLLWERFTNHRGRPVGLGLAMSMDGGETFTEPLVVPGIGQPGLGFNGSQQGLLMNKLAVNRTGQLAVVNSTFDRNESSHIWLIRADMAHNP